MPQRLSILAILVLVPTAALSVEPKISYQRDVQPLLADACYRCHGPDASTREAGLRLDLRNDALKPAESGLKAIVPGQPDQSELVHRILSDDPAKRMPPPDARRQLQPAERQRLRDWVSAGAPFDQHWSFTPIQRPVVPEFTELENAAWCRTPIDRFVLAKLRDARLPPATEANATTLLRRVSFGLTGLPPTTDEIDELLAKDSVVSVNRYVAETIDRRLASVAYGEHWARHWMDVVRYADSAGYELDYPFEHSWQYRDWLIRGFQANKPLDRFLQEQIAGDQLWPESDDARDGTLFLAVGPRRFEGGIQRSNERDYEWLTDVADTAGSAFLGLTLGCSRCHDHKFDALTQQDYFGLQAIFGDSRLEEKRLGDKGGDLRPAVLRVARRDPPAAVQILRRGEIEQPLGVAQPAVPVALSRGGPVSAEPPTQRRAALARWLTATNQPLTARVMVNRVWSWHFGQGLVRTPNDFGVQGERPTHPELLDWLASELVDSGWDLKHLHRLILHSATYRMSSTADAAVESRDPQHRLLTRFPRRRLQAEELQDSMRLVAGRLERESFGPPIVPSLEPWALAGLRNANWQPTKVPAAAQRRGIYMVVRRSMKLPFFDAFNGPDTVNSCAARDTTTTPLQALTLLNSPETLVNAQALAARLWDECHGDETRAAKQAWRTLFGRNIRDDELDAARQFLTASPPVLGSGAKVAGVPRAWSEWTSILLNSSEFSYVD